MVIKKHNTETIFLQHIDVILKHKTVNWKYLKLSEMMMMMMMIKGIYIAVYMDYNLNFNASRYYTLADYRRISAINMILIV